MKDVKVYLEDGNSFCTAINGTNEEINKYYLGNTFNVDHKNPDLIEDHLVKVIKVEFLS